MGHLQSWSIGPIFFSYLEFLILILPFLDLIKAAHSNAKSQIKTITSEEISKATGGFGIPGFKWPF